MFVLHILLRNKNVAAALFDYSIHARALLCILHQV